MLNMEVRYEEKFTLTGFAYCLNVTRMVAVRITVVSEEWQFLFILEVAITTRAENYKDY